MNETESRFIGMMAQSIAAQRTAIFRVISYINKMESDRKMEAHRQKMISEDHKQRYQFEKDQFEKRINEKDI